MGQDGLQNRGPKFFYEFIGTALISYCFNVSPTNFVSPLLLVSILVWEMADAHFNLSITIADFILNVFKNPDNMVDNAITMGVIIFAQISGAFFGNGLARAATIDNGS